MNFAEPHTPELDATLARIDAMREAALARPPVSREEGERMRRRFVDLTAKHTASLRRKSPYRTATL